MATEMSELYAVGHGVSVPTVRGYSGGKERCASAGSPGTKRRGGSVGIKSKKVSGSPAPLNHTKLNFTHEVVQERSPHTITYSQTKLDSVFDPCILPPTQPPAVRSVRPKRKSHPVLPKKHSCVHKETSFILPPIDSPRYNSTGEVKQPHHVEDLIQDVPATKTDFLTQLHEGAKPVHRTNAKRGTIQLGDVEYNVPLQASYPNEPNKWCKSVDTTLVNKITKGRPQWTGLPQPIEPPPAMEWSEEQIYPIDTNQLSSHLSIDDDIVDENKEYIKIAREWYGKWGISLCLQGVTLPALLTQLSSINEGVQLTALATCGKMASVGIDSVITTTNSRRYRSDVSLEDDSPPALQQLIEALERLLDSRSEPVRIGAAVVMYTLGAGNTETEEVLLACLTTSAPAESWAAVQCLAHIGVCRPVVVQLLMTYLHSFHDSKQQSQAAALLGLLSRSSKLVHAMVAEELKSINWQERVAACKLMPLLHEGINKDMCDTLLYLMLEDWNPQVRNAAANALGETGNGKVLHDELQRRLSEGNEVKRMDALRKIYTLKLMTPKLLPVFLSCLSDEYISIKIEAISIAGGLQLQDGSVIEKLLVLLHDTCWKIRAHAIKALGDIGLVSHDITKSLLWCARNDRVPVVRRQACHAIACLHITTDITVTTLKDMLELDDDQDVQCEVAETLIKLGFDPEPSHSTADMITEEIKRLSTQEAITQRIMQQTPSSRCSSRNSRSTGSSRPPIACEMLRPKNRTVYNQTNSPSNLVKLPDKTWTPDTTFINTQLELIRKKCLMNT